MYNFTDVFKKSFIEGYGFEQVSTTEVVAALFFAGLIGAYIFFCYRLITRRTFYSRNYNVSLVALSLITCGVILAVQSSVVVSLGMVGALSIVRFRTAIKEPMDLIFLFWSISIGIICGVGLFELGIILSVAVTVAIIVFDHIPIAGSRKILVITSDNYSTELDNAISSKLGGYTKYFNEKSKSIVKNHFEGTYEIRGQKNDQLINAIRTIRGVNTVAILEHNGEVTF